MTPPLATLSVIPTIEASGPIFALTNGLLIDGMGRESIPEAILLIQGERILAVGEKRTLTIPSQAQVMM